MPRQGLKTYDPNRVIVTINGVRIQGFAGSDSIKATRDTEHYTFQKGIDGAITRSRNQAVDGMISLTFQQTAPANKILNDLMKSDLLTGAGLFTIQIRDSGGYDSAFSVDASVFVEPEMAFGEESGDREWIIGCAHLDLEHGGAL